MIDQAVILAGGKGSRLGKLTNQIPKPLIMIAGKPFLGYLLRNLGRHGIRDVVLSVGYLREKFFELIGDGKKYGVNIRYVEESHPLGTGGGLRNFYKLLQERFLVLNGDSLFDINYLDLSMGLKNDADTVLALRQVHDAGRYGCVKLENDRIVGFAEKSHKREGLINGGVYAFTRKCVEDFPHGFFSLEEDLFPILAQTNRLQGRIYNGYFIDIGIPSALAKAQEEIYHWQKKPAVFFDHDVVINEDRGYVRTRKEFHWQPGAVESVKFANDNGLLAILVTNQAGRGDFSTAEAFRELTQWMQQELRDHGAHFDDVLYCPQHRHAGIENDKVYCDYRGQKTRMLLDAMKRWNVDVTSSLMVGHKMFDFEAAKAAGIPRTRLYTGGNLLGFLVAQLNLIKWLRIK